MNYKKHYDLLVNRSPKEKPKNGYYEKHRILPGCMGGEYTKNNITWLTPEEHYLAHQLLVKIYPNDSKLIYAVRMMAVSSENQKRNNKIYGWLKRKFIYQLSIDMIGNKKGCGNKGKSRKYLAEHNSELFSKSANIVTPTGEFKQIRNISKFCKDNNIDFRNFQKVLTGKRIHCLGYRGEYVNI
jgi:hypothetical protein